MLSEDGGDGTISSSRTVRRARFNAGAFFPWRAVAEVARAGFRTAARRAIGFGAATLRFAAVFRADPFRAEARPLAAVAFFVALADLRPAGRALLRVVVREARPAARVLAVLRVLAAAALRLAMAQSFPITLTVTDKSRKL